ncbi:MAG: peptidoglycan-associated lipoprotein Pal [Bdellovibrio sp.]|nr:peptidoglycan-associated lipoprotein Pal [Methylotenera sp.]
MTNLNTQYKLSTKLLMALAISTALVACKSTPMKPAAVEDKSPSASTAGNTKPVDNSGADTNAIKEAQIDSNASMDDKNNPLKDPNNILSKRNIYFDYNSDAVKAEYRPIIEAHSKYLLAHPDTKVVVQGNTDERGTREYNVSLGQRRSVAVKKALNLLGVKDNQIETISYGEEKAVQNCDNEDCFAKNRRADVVYEGD